MRDLKGAQHALAEEFVRRQAGNILAAQRDRARCRLVHAGDHVEQRRFARAVRPEQAGDGAFGDLERNAVDGVVEAGDKLAARRDDFVAQRQAQATNLRVEKVARARLAMRAATPAVTQYVFDNKAVPQPAPAAGIEPPPASLVAARGSAGERR